MNLHRETQDILRFAEEVSGRPVLVQPDATLATLARVTIAQGSAPAHVLRVKPGAAGLDYLVAYQCGFIIRLYQMPPAMRANFESVESGRASLRSMLVGPGGTLRPMNLPDTAVKQVTDQLFDGLLTQLRSVTVGMRVDAWLRDDYRALRSSQADSWAAQQRDNLQALSPQVRAMAPPTAFSASVAMNAAFALFCDRLLGQSLYAVPYRAAGAEEWGRDLLDLWDGMPSEAANDRELVDTWGRELGLTDWYQFQPMLAEGEH